MPELFIGGAWRSALDGRTREIRCPADGSLVAVVDEADAKDTVKAIAAATTPRMRWTRSAAGVGPPLRVASQTGPISATPITLRSSSAL